ncbi:50S ribosomal protein L4 [Candidatus Micrarchaeota archaeon]|nr:50S ribosomal protein L4 [Candidatus Micrarchaeota archaeon]MBU2476673.1 50S ribosomal protein L4 [Candidatus Micrarchaeota archaeon]
MKAQIISLKGEKIKEIELPKVFETEYFPELIKRAVLSIQSNSFQKKGADVWSGRKTTAEYIGIREPPTPKRSINTGMARRPRTKNRRYLLYGKVAGISGAVKGPKAFAPLTEKKIKEKINKKEKKKAFESAVAATASKDLVKKRGHKFEAELPLIIENTFEKIKKTKEVSEVLKTLKLWEDVERAKKRKIIRAGKGKRRGRKYKKAKSILIVTGEKSELKKSSRNIEGIEVINSRNLNTKLLAPGTVAGRLTLWTENAIKELSERNE